VIIPEGGEGALGQCSNKAETVKGTAANPLAYPGYLCIYATVEEATILPPYKAGVVSAGAGTAGAVLVITGSSGLASFGSWAVTACPEGGCTP
jgi:hypothetical protein